MVALLTTAVRPTEAPTEIVDGGGLLKETEIACGTGAGEGGALTVPLLHPMRAHDKTSPSWVRGLMLFFLGFLD